MATTISNNFFFFCLTKIDTLRCNVIIVFTVKENTNMLVKDPLL